LRHYTLERNVYATVKRTYNEQLQKKRRRLVDSVELFSPLSVENRSMLAGAYTRPLSSST
jgi:hypothetical protein